MSARVAVYVALLLAGVVTAVTIRNNSFAPWGTDPGSYINAARRWAEADLFEPDALQLWPRWNQFGVPLGSTPSAIRGTYVTMYPLGFPVLLAVGDLVDPELGAYAVAPFFAGVLVLTTFFLTRTITTTAGALLAATLVALSPVVLIHAVTPMSDVPATALLMLAVLMSLRPSGMAACAGGLALTMAVMTRPVLAPLGIVPFALILMRRWFAPSERTRVEGKHAALFAAAASIGPALLAWSQLVLYGSALKSGYPGFENFFSRDRIAINAEVLVRNLATLHSPFVFLGLAAVVPLYFTRAERDRRSLVVVVALMLIALINYALYLPYLTFDDVWSTRFLLPAQVALFVLLAAAVNDAVIAVSRLARVLAIVCVIPAVIVASEGAKLFSFVFGAWPGQAQTRLMGYYLRDALPRNAAVISYLHSAAFAFNTGAQIVRFDFMSPADAEVLIEALKRRGYEPVVVIDTPHELATYMMAVNGTKYQDLTWPERAMSMGSGPMLYLALGDRDRPRDALPATDVLKD
jgi:hypothetical protein